MKFGSADDIMDAFTKDYRGVKENIEEMTKNVRHLSRWGAIAGLGISITLFMFKMDMNQSYEGMQKQAQDNRELIEQHAEAIQTIADSSYTMSTACQTESNPYRTAVRPCS